MNTASYIPENEERIAEAVAEYLQARENGTPFPIAEWLSVYADIACQLREFLDDSDGVALGLRTFRGGANEPDLQTEERYLGDYELVERIGGNMGIIYRARQRSLPREVAVKLLLRGEPYRDRFRAEAEAMARLHHPNIVRILEVSRGDVPPYFSMEWHKGGSLDRRYAEYINNPGKAVDLVETVARAVHFAHQRGVLHRDLKPANVLLDEFGRPIVADFGLAVPLNTSDLAERAGAGTPAFMAPEQITGDVTVATDVHGLGALLFALLTGRPPFYADSLAGVFEQVRFTQPRPGDFNPRVDADLDAICQKCLAKAPVDRYATAAELAEDLSRWKGGRSIAARPLTTLARVGRVLQQARPATEFRAIGPGLIVLAFLSFATNMAAFVLLRTKAAEPWVWLAVFSSYIPLVVVLVREWRTAPDRYLPARNHLWSIWAGHLAACTTMFLAFRINAGPDFARGIEAGYIGSAGLNALAFVTMGSLFAGRHFLFGTAWVLSSLVMGMAPSWAPLIYAVVIAACNLLAGAQLRGLLPEGESGIGPIPPSQGSTASSDGKG